MIAKIGESKDDNNNWYYFSDLSANLGRENVVLFPHQYFKIVNDQGLFFNVNLDEKYDMTGSPEEIVEFYQSIKIYNVSKVENGIEINMNEDASFTDKHTKNAFKITFLMEGDKQFAIFTLKSE